MTGTLQMLTGPKTTVTWDTEDDESVAAYVEQFIAITAQKGTVIAQDGTKLSEPDPTVSTQAALSAFAGG